MSVRTGIYVIYESNNDAMEIKEINDTRVQITIDNSDEYILDKTAFIEICKKVLFTSNTIVECEKCGDRMNEKGLTFAEGEK
jgi:hypothetical protein